MEQAAHRHLRALPAQNPDRRTAIAGKTLDRLLCRQIINDDLAASPRCDGLHIGQLQRLQPAAITERACLPSLQPLRSDMTRPDLDFTLADLGGHHGILQCNAECRADVTDLATAGLHPERSCFVRDLEPGAATQQLQAALAGAEIKCQRAACIQYGSAAILQLHRARRVVAAHIAADQQPRVRRHRHRKQQHRRTGQQPRQSTTRLQRPQRGFGGQFRERSQDIRAGGIQALPESLLLAPGIGMPGIGLQPALQGVLLALRQPARIAPYHPAQRLPGLTRRGYGRTHDCSPRHHQRVRLTVETTVSGICPRHMQVMRGFPAGAAG
ncbi:hypothetical protein D3C73_708890 [compost metagenome]